MIGKLKGARLEIRDDVRRTIPQALSEKEEKLILPPAFRIQWQTFVIEGDELANSEARE